MITAESFMNQWITKPLDSNDVENLMVEFAKMHVKACKKDISEDFLYYLEGDEGSERLNNKKFNKEAYPLENIK